MSILKQFIATCCCLTAVAAHAATIHGPTPYVDLTDTPDGVFSVGPNDSLHVENFEDPNGPWEECFSIDVGERIGPKFVSGDNIPVTDSVDSDDGAIDGDGTMGSSWFANSRSLTISFDSPTKAAGFVFTDTDTSATMISISAYGVDGAELIRQDFDTSFVDDVFTGTTVDDRFFGITAMGSDLIAKVKVAIDRGTGIEIDHVQFIKTVPEPSALALVGIGLLGLGGLRRRR